LLVIGYVLPEVPEIFRCEGMSVGPTVPWPEPQRKNAALLNFQVFQNVRDEIQLLVVADEPGIAIDDDHSDVLGISHQHPDPATVASGLSPQAAQIDDTRLMRNSLLYGRKLALHHCLFQIRWFDHLPGWQHHTPGGLRISTN